MRAPLVLLGTLVLGACNLNLDAPEQPVVSLDRPPPPIAGGTLAIAGNLAVVGDPDRDAIHVIDLVRRERVQRIALPEGSEPGRAVAGPDGRVHVVLRGAGAIASVHDAALHTTPVCDAPRGLDVDDAGVLFVACHDGAIWRVDADEARAIATLEPGLRDLVVLDGVLLVSHLRSARVEVLAADGTHLRTLHAPNARVDGLVYAPNTAFRLRRRGGRAWLVHQRSRVGAEPVPTDAYAGTFRGPCGESSVQVVVSEVTPSGFGQGVAIRRGSLAVDVDVDASGAFALALPGEIGGLTAQRTRRVRRVRAVGPCLEDASETVHEGQAIAVAFGPHDELVTFSREPARVQIGDDVIELDEESRRDTGHDLFHVRREGVSCASCHAEGGEDGHLWTMGASPARRTRTLRGGIVATAPFHADGSVASLHEVMRRQFPDEAHVYLDAPKARALATWLDALAPRARPRADHPGAQVFEDAGCASCHAGALGTGPGVIEVGTRRAAIPTLIDLADRAPFLADGCASTLEAVFDASCGLGPEHTMVSALSLEARDELLTYLRSR
jgi:mono/diheme cytochrome c family protein